MQVQVHIDHNMKGLQNTAAGITIVMEHILNRVSNHITRVEVHLSDENGKKTSRNDKRCMIEARLEGHQPIAVTHRAATPGQALEGAADKLTRSIENILGRLYDQKRHRTDPSPPGSEIPELL